jgi:hypothetical protein
VVEVAVRGAPSAGAADGRTVLALADRAERHQSGPLIGLDGAPDRFRALAAEALRAQQTASAAG